MKAHHILNAASNLLGVALLIVTFVHVTGHARQTYSDELAFSAAILLLGTCILSQRAISASVKWLEDFADLTFFVAQILLLCAVVSFWF
jgi:hypothetical protein